MKSKILGLLAVGLLVAGMAVKPTVALAIVCAPGANCGPESDPPPPVTSLPEPGTLALLGLGLAGLGLSRRRKAN